MLHVACFHLCLRTSLLAHPTEWMLISIDMVVKMDRLEGRTASGHGGETAMVVHVQTKNLPWSLTRRMRPQLKLGGETMTSSRQ